MTMNSTNENLVQVFCGVRGYEEDDVAYLHIEDAARGLGFTTTTEKGGVEYTNVRWSRVDECLQDLNFLPQVAENGKPHDYYIPENIFYRLCMKAKNEVAEKFQAKVADEIIPSIRKTGSYSINHPQISRKDQLFLDIIHAESEDARVSALTELNEINKQEVKALEAQRDEAIRTKAQIGDKKVASAMGTAGALSKKCDRLEKELDKVKSEMNLQVYNACSAIRKEFEGAWMTARDWCYNHQLTVKTKEPKLTVSARLSSICAAYPNRDQWRTNAYSVRMFPKWACDILDKVYDEDETFLREYRIV